jgi:hypothetical protein
MESRIAQGRLGSFRAPIIKVNVILPGEAHAAMHLDSTVAYGSASIAGVHFGD